MDRHARRVWLFAVLFMLPAAAAALSPTATIAHLPNVRINAAKVDASGNIYVAGQTSTTAGSAAYIAKLSGNGATTFYTIAIGGSGASATTATVLDIDSAGAAYVAGTPRPLISRSPPAPFNPPEPRRSRPSWTPRGTSSTPR